MPEEFMWLLAGLLGSSGQSEMALFQVALFDTYLRPSALLGLYCDDVVSPLAGRGGFHVLVIAPVEREKSTKTGSYDETVLLNGDLCPQLGVLLQEHADRRMAAEYGDDWRRLENLDPLPLWSFQGREFYSQWRGGVEYLGLPEMDSVYQARHGGASRDFLLRKRSKEEIQLRLHHSTTGSFRIYHKPGRILKLVNSLDGGALKLACQVRDTFAECVRSGEFPRPLRRPCLANDF